MQFSYRFKQLCKEKGVTQKQALADMGMGRNSAQSWIDGSPSLETLEKMAGYFGMSTDDLLGKDNNKKTPTVSGERSYDDEHILDAIEKADPVTREAILLLLGLR